MLTIVMVWNALVSRGFLLHGWVRPLPYFVLAVTALVWHVQVWASRYVIYCTAILVVGTTMRGIEVLFFADATLRGRLTGVSLWVTMAGTAMAFGILNLIAISRKEADEWVWQESAH